MDQLNHFFDREWLLLGFMTAASIERAGVRELKDVLREAAGDLDALGADAFLAQQRVQSRQAWFVGIDARIISESLALAKDTEFGRWLSESPLQHAVALQWLIATHYTFTRKFGAERKS